MNIGMDDSEKKRLLEMKADAAKAALASSVSRDFANVDMRSVSEQFEDAKEQLLTKLPNIQAGAFLITAIGLDAKGEVHGMFGCGGTVSSMTVLRVFIESSIRATLAAEGACGCDACFQRIVLDLVLSEREEPEVAH